MDWEKLIGFSAVLFMLLEIVKIKLDKLKETVSRVIVLVLMIAACVGLALVSPVVTLTKASFIVNVALYFVVEYFIYLFLKNELKLSLKNFLLSKFGGTVPPENK